MDKIDITIYGCILPTSAYVLTCAGLTNILPTVCRDFDASGLRFRELKVSAHELSLAHQNNLACPV
jgi:hypothetical protein